MKKGLVFKKNECRVCSFKKLIKILDFGPTPLANAFLNKEQVDKEEYFYPLEVYYCGNCSFVQLGHVVSPNILFDDYVYASSTSPVFINHFIEFAEKISKRFNLDSSSLVVDIGSNDGILLKPFKKKKINVLGIEPAKKIAEYAKKQGINTLDAYLSTKLASKIINNWGQADIITATNVFAHIDDLEEVISSIKILLKKDGVFIIEAPYLVDFIKNKYFDLVYHEHLSYWCVKTLQKLFLRYDLQVIDVEKVPVHGGSIRVFVQRKNSQNVISKKVNEFIKKEEKAGLFNIITYKNFAKEIEKNRSSLLNLLLKLKKTNKRIAGYGAPAKGNTLLNYFNIGTEYIDYIIDDSHWKQNLFTPGKRIPVQNFSHLENNKVDYIFILAWNFSQSIIEKNKNFSKSGGKFIIPAPKPVII